MNPFSRTATLAVLLAMSGAATAATTLCNRAVSDPCSILASWGPATVDTKPTEVRRPTGAFNTPAPPNAPPSAAAGRTVTTSLATPTKSSVEIESLLLALRRATFDRQNNLTGGKEAIRSAVESLRKVEPARELALRMARPAAMGYTDSRAFDARVRAINAFLNDASPGGAIVLAAGGR